MADYGYEILLSAFVSLQVSHPLGVLPYLGLI